MQPQFDPCCLSTGAEKYNLSYLDPERALYCRRGDRFWLLGGTMLFLAPSLILFSLGLLAVGSVWLALWLVYLLLYDPLLPKGPARAEEF